MRRKNLMTALMCTVVLSAATVMAPMTAMADETEAATEAVTEAETDAEGEEAETEAGEEETEQAVELVERPDYTASDYVELGEYKGLTVQIQPITVTDDEITDQIRANAGSDILEEVTEGTVAEGDTANIDYEGKLDGEAFEGGTAKDYDLEIGSGTFIDGFEDGLVGVAVGDTVDLPLTFPENYTEELAGKDVIFTVTVNSVKRMPELTSELVSKITNDEYTDVDQYRESVRASIMEDKEASRDSEINNALLTQIASGSTIKEYPEELVNYVASNMTNYYQEMAGYYSMEFADFLEQYLGVTEEEFAEQVKLAAQQNLQAELYLKAIAETEGIELSDEEYELRCEEYANQFGYASTEEFMAAYTEDEIRISALQDKVLDFLTENALVEEETEAETEAGTEDAAEDQTETEQMSENETEADTEAQETETEAE